ncbi:hypothetical protein GF356_00380 [candidate division GN15 bacterium]|nr:hypothetical protein [candidate division GN15 bacterium]
MKRLLLVCYYFPPLGGAGINRPLALFKQLPTFDWNVHVLTVKSVTYRMYEPDLLESLDTEHIYRSGSRDPQRLMWLMGLRQVKPRAIERARPASDRFFPDSKTGWLRPAVRLGRTLVANQQYDALVSTSPPITCHLVARQLAREAKLPWIADFRDYWTSRKPAQWYRTNSQVDRAEKLLAEIAKQATTTVAVNDAVGEYIGAMRTIPNAYDPDLTIHWQQPDPRQFVIGLLGTYNDMLPIAPLITVLERLRQTHPGLYDRVKILHAGDIDPDWLHSQLPASPVAKRFTSLGFLPRQEAVAKLSAASVFYMCLASEADLGITTARVYDMIASGRPIMAALPGEGELSNLLSQFEHSLVYPPNRPQPAAEWLANRIAIHERGEVAIATDTPQIKQYSSQKLAERYARLLNEVIGSPPAT